MWGYSNRVTTIPFLTPVPVLLTREWKLTAADRRLAVDVAKARQADNEARGRPDAYGATTGLELHIQGTLSELAFARMAGVPLEQWQAVVDTPDLTSIPYDVAGCQIRSTRHGRGRLPVHPADVRDHPLQPYVLVINRCPAFTAPGWVYAAEASREEWWDRPVPSQAAAWWVPQADLNPWPGLPGSA